MGNTPGHQDQEHAEGETEEITLPDPQPDPARSLVTTAESEAEELALPDPQPGPARSLLIVGRQIGMRREITRGRIAAALLVILGFMVVGSFVSLWFGWASGSELDALLTLLFGPVIGLVGAATGFYFGEQRNDGGAT